MHLWRRARIARLGLEEPIFQLAANEAAGNSFDLRGTRSAIATVKGNSGSRNNVSGHSR